MDPSASMSHSPDPYTPHHHQPWMGGDGLYMSLKTVQAADRTSPDFVNSAVSFVEFRCGVLDRGCGQTQPEVSAFWRGKENFVHKRFFIKYRQINIFKVKNTILYENCILWALTAYEKYCCHPLKIEKFVPNGKPLKYRHSRVGKCH